MNAPILEVVVEVRHHVLVEGPHARAVFGLVPWHGVVWYGTVWYGMAQYGMVWYGIAWGA